MRDLAGLAWRLDPHAGFWLTDADLRAVTEWMCENHMDRATAERAVVVANGTITYGQDCSPSYVRSPDRDIRTTTTPLLTAPPTVQNPTCDPNTLADLLAVFRAHEWSSGFGGVCVDCSDTRTDEHGRLCGSRETVAPWPCHPVRAALEKAGLPVPGCVRSPRVLGDCLDPDVQARAFA